jgi:PKD repeat protein
MLSSKNKTLILALIAFSALIIQSTLVTTAKARNPSVFVNLATDKQIYKVGDAVRITGNVTADGAPVYDALVAVQVNSPNNMPLLLRTAQTGQIANMNWQVNITALYASDSHSNPVNNFTRGGYGYATINWTNNGDLPAYTVLALYIQYSNGVPYMASFPEGATPRVMFAHTSGMLTTSFPIPPTAPYGTTTMYASIYTDTPKENGYPYCPEKNATFTIVTPNPTPPPETQTPPNFGVRFLLYNAVPGEYNVYAAASYSGSQASNMLTFPVQPNPVPPMASFLYFPPAVGVNLTTTYDASPSLALGYNDTITRYEWNFGDGTPVLVKNGTYDNPPNPVVTHVFTQNQTYTVTLNATTNVGLWNTTSKTISANLIIPPTADFTWSPPSPLNNTVTTFDGSPTQRGWNGTAHPPITSYRWDFGDGNITTVTTPTIGHTYLNPANYTVTLTVTDAQGSHASANKIVAVFASPTWDIPGDLDSNGKVNMGDVVIVLNAFGSTPGKPNWNPMADEDLDGRVTMGDVSTVISNFGRHL